jgi:chloride channel 7
MVTLIAARWVGNSINESLYDIHIHLNGLPLLESSCPEVAVINDMCVRQVMSKSIVSLNAIMTVGDLYDTVCATEHDLFPVVRPKVCPH